MGEFRSLPPVSAIDPNVWRQGGLDGAHAFAHDKAQTRLNVFLWKSFLASVDGIIYLSWESKRQIEGRYPAVAQKKSTVIQHGDYLDWIARRVQARRVPCLPGSHWAFPPMQR